MEDPSHEIINSTTNSLPNVEVPSKTEQGNVSPNESEYDSAGSYSDDDKVRSRETDPGSESEGSIILEREEGDGQESAPQRKVDDDEDKKNPQYIPKRGTFYEHDDRTADDVENADPEEAEKTDKDAKKKIWQDKKERWSHDRFNDVEQAPKSKTELVQIYGYDIRNEDGPPRARRRRRYGRGPNKYTRNWEDENAYGKPVPVKTKKTRAARSNQEEFPPLPGNDEGTGDISVVSEKAESSRQSEESQPPLDRNNQIPLDEKTSNSIPSNETKQPSNDSKTQRVGSGRVIKPKKEIKDSDYRGFTTKSRLNRNVKKDKPTGRPFAKSNDYIQSQNFTNKSNSSNAVQEVEINMSKLNVHDGVYKGGQKHNQRQGSMPPRLQSEQKGSKRYSSIRQRSLPETSNPPMMQHSNYYPNEFNNPSSNQQAQALLHQAPALGANVPQIPPPPLAPLPQAVPVTATTILQAPPQFGPPPFPQAPPTYLQPGVAPAAFISQQTPQLINYVQGATQFPQGYQGYQAPFNPVTQPAELYQPQGGITYYSADQQIPQRSVPTKRPKAAIPIVPPPAYEPKHLDKKQDPGDANTNEIVESQQ